MASNEVKMENTVVKVTVHSLQDYILASWDCTALTQG